MKRLLLIMYLLAGLLLASNYTISQQLNHYENDYLQTAGRVNNLSTTSDDQHIEVDITKDSNEIRITHRSSLHIQVVVAEYAFIRDGEKISHLGQFDVRGNTFKVPIGSYAVKVHQVKTLINNLWYTYMASGNNTAGDFSGVKREGFIDIETRTVRSVATDMLASNSQLQSHLVYIYEFYFDLEIKHDALIHVDVQYIFNRYYFGVIQGSERIEEKKEIDTTYQAHGYEFVFMPEGAIHNKTTRDYIGLESNKGGENPGDYVVRVSPSNNKFFDAQYQIENFAIIRVGYMLNGEFIIDDVINNPTTPQDQINNALDWLLSLVDKVKNIFSDISRFFGNNVKNIFIFIGVIILLILLGPAMSILKLLISFIKLLFTLPGKLINALKFLFIPNKKKNNNNKRRN